MLLPGKLSVTTLSQNTKAYIRRHQGGQEQACPCQANFPFTVMLSCSAVIFSGVGHSSVWVTVLKCKTTSPPLLVKRRARLVDLSH